MPSSRSKLDRVRELLPPDGADLVDFNRERRWSRSDLVADDVKVRFVSRAGATMGGTGPDAFNERWEDWLEPWASYRIYSEDLIDRGDRVIWLVQLVGETRRGGVQMGHEGATVFRFEGDKVVEIVFTMNRDDVLDE
jgi:hypothetical protein